MKIFLLTLAALMMIAQSGLYATEIRTSEEEGYTEEIGGQLYRYGEEGQYKGYGQKSGDETRYYDNEGNLQGQSADIGGEYEFLDKEQ